MENLTVLNSTQRVEWAQLLNSDVKGSLERATKTNAVTPRWH